MLHCILRQSAAPGRGLPDGLRAVPADGLLAVVADVAPDLVRGADPARLQAFADLIGRLHRASPLVPMRFGCVLADDAAVRALLGDHREALRVMLDLVAGCDEFGLRLLLPAAASASVAAPAAPAGPPNGPPARPGHRHLAAIRQRLQGESAAQASAAAARAAVTAALAGLYRDCREEFGQFGAQPMLSLYFLVPRQHQARFIAALRALGQTENQPAGPAPNAPPTAAAAVCWEWGTGLLTGPWPPYNFVGAIDGEARSLV